MVFQTQPQKILFLAANPKDTSRLRLDEEIRNIQEGLKLSTGRDSFELLTQWALRPRDLRRALLEHDPQIVHFSGHGEGKSGLVLENDLGKAQTISSAALANLFKLCPSVRCVFLNSCYSKVQATAIANHIPYVIGMNEAIGDAIAIRFAVGFYDALGYGRSLPEAYEFGMTAIESEPSVITRDGSIYSEGTVCAMPLQPAIPVLIQLESSLVSASSQRANPAFHDYKRNEIERATNFTRDAFSSYGLPLEKSDTILRSADEKVLINAVWTEIEDRLRQSLHNAILIRLDMAEQRTQVSRPWDSQLRTADQTVKKLSPGTHIADVFDRQDVGGKLLVLGNPGSGKTTTMLDLSAVLIQRANKIPDHPIPILFNLSSWQSSRQHITDWLLEEMKLKYGASKKLSQNWLKEKKLLPLLDGLDELPPNQQASAVKMLNAWIQSGEGTTRLLVCSRLEEYELYADKLALNAAIRLEPLTNQQLQSYLISLNTEALWNTLQQDAELLTLLRRPLLLSVSILANESIDIEQWQRKHTTAERIEYLLDTYVERRLHEVVKSKEYKLEEQPTAQQTRCWLVWLAKQLHEQSQDEFLIEQMQPAWLLNQKSKRLYKSTLGFMNGMIFGVSLCLISFISILLYTDYLPIETSTRANISISWIASYFVRTIAISITLGFLCAVNNLFQIIDRPEGWISNIRYRFQNAVFLSLVFSSLYFVSLSIQGKNLVVPTEFSQYSNPVVFLLSAIVFFFGSIGLLLPLIRPEIRTVEAIQWSASKFKENTSKGLRKICASAGRILGISVATVVLGLFLFSIGPLHSSESYINFFTDSIFLRYRLFFACQNCRFRIISYAYILLFSSFSGSIKALTKMQIPRFNPLRSNHLKLLFETAKRKTLRKSYFSRRILSFSLFLSIVAEFRGVNRKLLFREIQETLKDIDDTIDGFDYLTTGDSPSRLFQYIIEPLSQYIVDPSSK